MMPGLVDCRIAGRSFLLAALLSFGSAASAQQACDRSCLAGFLDQYLDALQLREIRAVMIDLPRGASTGW